MTCDGCGKEIGPGEGLITYGMSTGVNTVHPPLVSHLTSTCQMAVSKRLREDIKWEGPR